MMKLTLKMALMSALILVMACSGQVRAEGAEYVEVGLSAPQSVHPGEEFALTLSFDVGHGFHMYGKTSGGAGQRKLTLEMEVPPGLDSLGEWVWPKPEVIYEGREIEVYTGKQTFVRRFKLTSATDVVQFKVKATYQACNHLFCGPIESSSVSARVQVKAPASSGAVAAPGSADARGAGANSKKNAADIAYDQVIASAVLYNTPEEAKVYAGMTQAGKSLAWEQQKRTLAARAAAFYDRFPQDPRIEEVRELFLSNQDPYFMTAFAEWAEDFHTWGKEKWAAYFRAQPKDEAAKAAWLKKSEDMTADVVKSRKATLAQKEAAEWQLFGRYFRLASYDHNWMIPVDWDALVRRFDAHVAKYSAVNTLGQRADDYLGALKGLDPDRAAAGWRRIRDTSRADDKAAGSIALRATAEKQLTELGIVASGRILDLVKFTAVDGREVDLSTMKGKVVLLDFWAMWCGPCVQEMPTVKAVYERYREQGFEVIGISGDGGTKEQLLGFLKQHDYTWPQHFDGKHMANEMARRFNVTAWPTTYLIGKDGQVFRKNVRGGQIEAAVRESLGLGPEAG